MEIKNGNAFSEDINNLLDKYYSYILKQEEEYYRSLPSSITKLEKQISLLGTKIDIAENLVELLEKHEEGSLFDMFIGCYTPDLREYIDNRRNELTKKHSEYEQKLEFYELYTNLLNNGVLIKASDNGFYVAEPYDNGLYMLIK